MKSFYKSYVQAFVKFAQSSMDNRVIKTLSMYAIIITNKANDLLKRAALSSSIDIAKLSKELYEIGRVYVRKFGRVITGKNNDEVKKD